MAVITTVKENSRVQAHFPESTVTCFSFVSVTCQEVPVGLCDKRRADVPVR